MSMLSEQVKELREMGKGQRNNAKISEKVFLEIEKAFLQAADTIEALSAKLTAANREFAEYKDLERQGNLIKLPCKMGDMVYRINKGKKEPVIPMRVIGIAIRNENELVMQTKDIADNNYNVYSKTSIGKTVFLTEEEAREALERLEGK